MLIVFYEKHGCVNNTRQKALLRAAGHEVQVRGLLNWPWTREGLRTFFGARPVAEWFNPTAPRIKNGEIDPKTMDEAAALAAMLVDPLLIRRPLIEAGGRRIQSFDEDMQRWLGVVVPEALESCPKVGTAQAAAGCE
jgi:nitrogenase-associated protein